VIRVGNACKILPKNEERKLEVGIEARMVKNGRRLMA
jgi:hypothetical protein